MVNIEPIKPRLGGVFFIFGKSVKFAGFYERNIAFFIGGGAIDELLEIFESAEKYRL